ncbi:hypothetical protein [Halalkalibacter hemicellulosilyticus]|uniref:Uncharacterized protein n=1 Tax=Halalkalibacter hemicellulosilyticusJCM 9152 TaxID=1236971 RepID=W4QKM4_9BACI|nr:hypothetical protein [Halalkalibacter hemicellulosilyticus]GAE32432.1 hypothetical protein JCM9152_3967 [Halalkalibacter hemicellulosilyticusJCM 9152]
MLIDNFFVYAIVVYIISILVGFLLRVFYKTISKKDYHIRLMNVLILTFFMPIYAYRDIMKHRTEIIKEINSNANMNEDRKRKMRKMLNSKFQVMFRVILISILNFRDILDSNIEGLNSFKDEKGKEARLFTIRIEISRSHGKQLYRDIFVDKYA